MVTKRRISLMLVVILIISLIIPSAANARAMTQRECAEFLLYWMGYTEEDIARGGGIDQSAVSLGLVQDYIPNDPCTNDQFEAMRLRALKIGEAKPPIPDDPDPNDEVDPLPTEPPTEPETEPTVPETSEPETSEPETKPTEPETEPTEPPTEPTEPEPKSPMVFQDGLAQPIFDIDRDIERFCVYVETDYDTDGDGKLDLIKVLVQLPRAAMNGEYKAGVIYEARPYIAGDGYDRSYSPGGSYSESNLYQTAPKRNVKGTATAAEVAAKAKSGEYDFYEDLDWYDYFLVRGFAVVEAAGPGTRGSEGFETCGTDLEIDAFASVIEWLNGNSEAAAFTDRSNNIKVDADWCNGKVGMTGRSYAGTTQFGIAGTGVQGLETIVPVSGIASWYEYTNSQGYRTRGTAGYSAHLASYCASRYEDSNWDIGRYEGYLNSISRDESNLNGDYGKHFERRDYTLNPNIQCSALIVHGLNDTNVRTKNYQMMYNAFRNAGATVKLLLHQDGHVTPAYGANKTEQFINGEAYQQVLNRWFSHYVFGINNGAENMAAVTAQDNYDASQWNLYDSYPTVDDTSFNKLTMNSSSMKINRETTIMGTIPVTVKAIPKSTSNNNLLHVRLVDTSPSSFNAFPTATRYESGSHTSTGKTFVVGGGAQNYKVVQLRGEKTTKKIIAEGWMDLSNPSAAFASSSAVSENVKKGQQYTYTVYLQANVYRVAPGHTLKLEISANSGTIQSYSAAIPVKDAVTAPASYVVNYEAPANGSIISNVPNGENVAADTDVTLTAAPNKGYDFNFWTVNGKKVSDGATTTFSISEDTNIEASFVKRQAKEKDPEPAKKPDRPRYLGQFWRNNLNIRK